MGSGALIHTVSYALSSRCTPAVYFMAPSRAAARAAAPFEDVDGVRVRRGGKHGYKHVRGGQGRAKNLFQAHTPLKSHRTALYSTSREAAVAFAKKLFVGRALTDAVAQQPAAALALASVGAAHASAMPLPVAPVVGWPCGTHVPIPSVRGVLLTREQAAAAAARGLALAIAQ